MRLSNLKKHLRTCCQNNKYRCDVCNAVYAVYKRKDHYKEEPIMPPQISDDDTTGVIEMLVKGCIVAVAADINSIDSLWFIQFEQISSSKKK